MEDYFEWPLLECLFPYSFSGVQTGRNWIIAETKELLLSRIHTFVSEGKNSIDFKESRDTKVGSVKRNLEGEKLKPLTEWSEGTEAQRIQRRDMVSGSFDLQYAYLDPTSL